MAENNMNVISKSIFVVSIIKINVTHLQNNSPVITNFSSFLFELYMVSCMLWIG